MVVVDMAGVYWRGANSNRWKGSAQIVHTIYAREGSVSIHLLISREVNSA